MRENKARETIQDLTREPEELAKEQAEAARGGSLSAYFSKVQGEKQGAIAPAPPREE